MMTAKYYRIEEQFRPDHIYLRGPETGTGETLDPRTFTQCVKYGGPQPLRIPVRSGRETADFMFAAFDMPVVTERVGKLLRKFAPNDIQLTAAKIIGIPGSFEIANVITCRKAINEDFSEILWWTEKDDLPHKIGQYAAIGALVLDGKLASGFEVFRLQGWKPPLIISEKIKDAFQEIEVSGVSYRELKVV